MSYVWMIIGDLLVSERSPIGLQKVMFCDALAIVLVISRLHYVDFTVSLMDKLYCRFDD